MVLWLVAVAVVVVIADLFSVIFLYCVFFHWVMPRKKSLERRTVDSFKKDLGRLGFDLESIAEKHGVRSVSDFFRRGISNDYNAVVKQALLDVNGYVVSALALNASPDKGISRQEIAVGLSEYFFEKHQLAVQPWQVRDFYLKKLGVREDFEARIKGGVSVSKSKNFVKCSDGGYIRSLHSLVYRANAK